MLLTGICRSRPAATLAWCGREGPVCLLLAPGPHFSSRRKGESKGCLSESTTALHPALSKGGPGQH